MKQMNFKNVESLLPVEKVVNEAAKALEDKQRTISTSSIPEVLGGVVGAGVGAAVGFGALYTLGTVGLSAAGITSGLAMAGSIVGGGMVAGIGVLAAPVAILAVSSYGVLAHRKHKKLLHIKEELLRRAIQCRDGIILHLEKEGQISKERLEYLNSLNIMLQAAIKDLQADLAARIR